MNIYGDGLLCVHVSDIALRGSGILNKNNFFHYKCLLRSRIKKYLEKGKYVGMTGYIDFKELDFLGDIKKEVHYIEGLGNSRGIKNQADELIEIFKIKSINILEVTGGYRDGCLKATIKELLNTKNLVSENIFNQLYTKTIIDKLIKEGKIEIYSNTENEPIQTCIINNSLIF